jgi:hypothetical protein
VRQPRRRHMVQRIPAPTAGARGCVDYLMDSAPTRHCLSSMTATSKPRGSALASCYLDDPHVAEAVAVLPNTADPGARLAGGAQRSLPRRAVSRKRDDEMIGVGSDAAALICAARTVFHPRASDRERVLRRLCAIEGPGGATAVLPPPLAVDVTKIPFLTETRSSCHCVRVESQMAWSRRAAASCESFRGPWPSPLRLGAWLADRIHRRPPLARRTPRSGLQARGRGSFPSILSGSVYRR